MNATLYNIDPNWQKASKILESFTRTVIDIYLGIFAAVGTGFLVLFGAMFVIVGIALPIQNYASWTSSVVLIPLGFAWILSSKIRKITWIFLGFSVIWMIFLTATLIPFLDIDAQQLLMLQIILGFFYLIPPIVATAIGMNYKRKKC